MKKQREEKREWVYVTKYALTQGVFGQWVNSYEDSDRVNTMGIEQYASFYGPKEYARTREEAFQQAEQRRVRKIASIKKQLAKLEGMSFEVPD